MSQPKLIIRPDPPGRHVPRDELDCVMEAVLLWQPGHVLCLGSGWVWEEVGADTPIIVEAKS